MQIPVQIKRRRRKGTIISARIVVISPPLLVARAHKPEIRLLQRQLELKIVVREQCAAFGAESPVRTDLLGQREMSDAGGKALLDALYLSEFGLVAPHRDPAQSRRDGKRE